MKAKHLPLPWAVVDRRKAALPNVVICSGEEIVADIAGVHMRDKMLRHRWTPEEADNADARAIDNAEYIVRAVNAHAALVDGLFGLIAAVKSGDTAQMSLAVTDARAALELAERKK